MEEVEEAAGKYRGPKELLLAIGYFNRHWGVTGSGPNT
jgi:hypothetical protein